MRLQCTVNRELFRPLAKQLREHVAFAEAGTTAALSFREGILRIQVGAELFAIAADGQPWDLTIFVDPRSLALPQARLRGPMVGITLRKDKLEFGTLSVAVLEERS